jgi:hypothetical protein
MALSKARFIGVFWGGDTKEVFIRAGMRHHLFFFQ